MIAILVITLVVCALTADYFVLRWPGFVLSLRSGEESLGKVYVDPTHMWLVPERVGLARVGVDEAAGMLLGRPERIEWIGTGKLTRGTPLAVAHGHGRSLTLRCPVDGEVVERNVALDGNPAAIAGNPFETGWLVRMRPVNVGGRLAAMYSGERLREWSRQEWDRLRALILSRLPVTVAVGATAEDGGPLHPDLAQQLDETAFQEAVRSFFGTGGGDDESAVETTSNKAAQA